MKTTLSHLIDAIIFFVVIGIVFKLVDYFNIGIDYKYIILGVLAIWVIFKMKFTKPHIENDEKKVD